MRTASEVAKDKFYKLIVCHLDESCGTSHRIKIINGLAVTLTAFRNEAIEEAAKIAESNLLESLGRNEKAEIWLANKIRALKK